jgi:guanyl-specific ribonuclease Sa
VLDWSRCVPGSLYDMRTHEKTLRRTTRLLITALLVAFALAPVSASALAETAPAAYAPAALPTCALSSLPPEASDTLDLIHSGGPFPYPQDGTTFQNREGLLPSKPSGYYKEYTVETPGSPDRGARRLVAGGNTPTSPDTVYYTSDHYQSFCQVTTSSGIADCPLSSLPSQVASTIDLVHAGGPFPYAEDGTVYQNREGVLPANTSSYYHLYTVPTPGTADRGNRRLITGGGTATNPAILYYTPDRYATFCHVV